MKKLLITIPALLFCVGAFGQGSVSFDLNDGSHLIYFTSSSSGLLPADQNTLVGGLPIEGQGAYTGPNLYTGPGTGNGTIASLAGSPTFTAALFGGPTAGTMTLQTTTTLGDANTEGEVNGVSVYPTGIGAVQWTWEVQVYANINPALGSALSAGAAAAWAAGDYAGASTPFTATLNGTLPVSIWDSTPVASGGAGSSWANGTWQLTDFSGAYGAIAIYAVATPEPGTFALAGMGLAALLVFRRRNS